MRATMRSVKFWLHKNDLQTFQAFCYLHRMNMSKVLRLAVQSINYLQVKEWRAEKEAKMTEPAKGLAARKKMWEKYEEERKNRSTLYKAVREKTAKDVTERIRDSFATLPQVQKKMWDIEMQKEIRAREQAEKEQEPDGPVRTVKPEDLYDLICELGEQPTASGQVPGSGVSENNISEIDKLF